MTEATAIGLRVYVNVPRPAWEIVEGFMGRSTCHICDAMNRFGAMDHRIKPVDPSMKMAGTALTVRARPCDNLVIYKALEIARRRDVIVIGIYEYNTNSTWGDLTTMISQAKGLAGVVTDGLVRDLEGIRQVGFPVFARGATPNSPFKDGPGEINVPITCGGVPVHPGDIIVGDSDGVVVVPQGDAALVLHRLDAMQKKEEKAIAGIKAGKLTPDWVEGALREKGFQVIEWTPG